MKAFLTTLVLALASAVLGAFVQTAVRLRAAR